MNITIISIIFVMIIFIVSIVALTVQYLLYKKTLEKIGRWVYNFGPRFIEKSNDDYYKFSTEFLTEYEKYVNESIRKM